MLTKIASTSLDRWSVVGLCGSLSAPWHGLPNSRKATLAIYNIFWLVFSDIVQRDAGWAAIWKWKWGFGDTQHVADSLHEHRPKTKPRLCVRLRSRHRCQWRWRWRGRWRWRDIHQSGLSNAMSTGLGPGRGWADWSLERLLLCRCCCAASSTKL